MSMGKADYIPPTTEALNDTQPRMDMAPRI